MPPALALLLCLGLVAASQVSITEFTVPAQAKVGEDIRLACHYKLEEKESDSFYVKWWWTPLDAGPEQKLLIYQGLGHMPKFIRRPPVVNVTDNDIQLGKLQPNYSGKYECEVFNDWHEDRQSSDLFVYSPGSGPQLNVSTVADGDDDTDVQVTCEATDVAPEPVLTISVGGEDVNFTDLVVSDPEDGLYSIAVNVTLEDIADGAEVRCSLIFANEAIAHEPYDATYTYHASGAEQTTAVAIDNSTEVEQTTPTTTDGSEHTVLRTSWLLLATAAALSHLLAGVDRTL